ncbi:unnamed protein product, partial [Mesorhabditis belari]|uniref:Uncharacterized protein n=1 Tax=Mesorhabditis belari TaxID=2138241 RepID=A0AAF3E8M7_9BILA
MNRNFKQYGSSKRFKGRNEYGPASGVYSNPIHKVRNHLPQEHFFSRATPSSTGYSYLTPDWLETVHSKTNPQHSRDKKYIRRYREPESLPSTSYDHYAYGHTQHHSDFLEVGLEDYPKDREEACLVQQIEVLQREIDNIDSMREPKREVINNYLPEYSQQLYSRRSPIMKTERNDYYEIHQRHSSTRFPGNHSTNHSTLPRLMDLEIAANSRRTIPRTITERFSRKRTFRSAQGPYEKRREPREKVTRHYADRNRPKKSKAPQKNDEDLKDFASPSHLEEISENEEELSLIGLKTAHTAVQRWIADDCFPQQIRHLISEESSETLGKTNGSDDDCLFFTATENADNISLNLSEELKESLLLDFHNIANSTIES